MDAHSGQYKAGRILLLVGAILAVAGAALFVVGGILLIVIGETILGGEEQMTFAPTVVGIIYLGLGILTGIGAGFGFVAQARAQRGEAHGAWVAGLVAALVPPVQLLALVGAILILTSPEHAQQAGATS